jgi:putative hemolysin
MTVFYELLNKQGDRFEFQVGKLIRPEELEGDVNDVTRALEKHTVHDLAADGDATFVPVNSPAMGEEPQPLEAQAG